jgi:hypothetical protein
VVPLTAVVLLACAAVAVFLFPHGFTHAIGLDTQASAEYAFFSGFGAWLSSTIGLSAIIVTLWSHLDCHVDPCARIGRFRVAGGAYRVCRKHHDEITGHHGPLSVRSLREKHRLHAVREIVVSHTDDSGQARTPEDKNG